MHGRQGRWEGALAPSALTLFCFTEPLSRMWGQSLPVSSALMSATGTGKESWADHWAPRGPRTWGSLGE